MVYNIFAHWNRNFGKFGIILGNANFPPVYAGGAASDLQGHSELSAALPRSIAAAGKDPANWNGIT